MANALANGHRVPCGHEQNTPTMLRRGCSNRSARADREEPDEEGNATDDEGDDDEEDEHGYSVRLYPLQEW